MTNATLIINNSKALCDDIWQYENEFNEKQWAGSVESFAETLQEIYDDFSESIPDDRLYILGDVINFLNSIDVKVKPVGTENKD